MERRKLLQALTAIPASNIFKWGDKEAGRGYKIDSTKKYVVFVDPSVIDVEMFVTGCHAFPPGTTVHCVAVPGSLDDAVRIFEIGGEPSQPTT